MNAVRADEYITLDATPISKVEASCGAVLVMADHARAEMQCWGCPRFECLYQNAKQVGPIECHIGKAISGDGNEPEVEPLPGLSCVPHAEFAANRLGGHRHHRVHN